MEILAQPGRLGQSYPVKIKDSDNVGYTYKKPQTSWDQETVLLLLGKQSMPRDYVVLTR